MLGAIEDPVFGKTIASFSSQIRMSTENVSFGIDPILDSVVLMLRYSNIYGETNSIQNVKVYELDELLSYDSAYYSNHNVKHYPVLLADRSFVPDLKDSVKIYTSKVAPHLRINLSKLTSYFGNKLLYAPENILLSNTNFIKFVKGLYLESSPVSANGGLVSFDMNNSLTKMVVYFKNHDSTGKIVDSLTYDFVISSSCARFNTFNHDHYADASPEFKAQVLNHDTTQGKNLLFLQGLSGVRIKFKLPNIKNYIKSNKIAVNNAFLILKNFETDTTLAPPPTITLVKVDSSGKMGYVIDDSEGSAYFGGTYMSGSRTYQFRITRYIQQILSGASKNYDLYLMVNDPASNVLVPNRMIGIGTSPGNATPKSSRYQLQLVFTKLF